MLFIFLFLFAWLSAFVWVLYEIKNATLEVLEDLQERIAELNASLKEKNIDFDVHEFSRSFFGEDAGINYYVHFFIKCPVHAKALIFSKQVYLTILKSELYHTFLSVVEQEISDIIQSSQNEYPATEMEDLSVAEMQDIKSQGDGEV